MRILKAKHKGHGLKREKEKCNIVELVGEKVGERVGRKECFGCDVRFNLSQYKQTADRSGNSNKTRDTRDGLSGTENCPWNI